MLPPTSVVVVLRVSSLPFSREQSAGQMQTLGFIERRASGRKFLTTDREKGLMVRPLPVYARPHPLHEDADPQARLRQELEMNSAPCQPGEKAGVVTRAHGGTLFMDEIGQLAPEGQGMLLRFLQEGEGRAVGDRSVTFDVRVIAVTRRNLEAEWSVARSARTSITCSGRWCSRCRPRARVERTPSSSWSTSPRVQDLDAHVV